MERVCEEPHCLQRVPHHLFQSHQDHNYAERVAAEEFESRAVPQTVIGNTITDHPGALDLDNEEDEDLQLALALNREFRKEEEKQFFRQFQVILGISLTD